MTTNPFANNSMAGTVDQWEYDRQQNIIDEIDNASQAGSYSEEGTPEYETAQKRKREAQAIQNYLVRKVSASEEVNDAVDAADAAWVEANPRPVEEAPEGEPVE